MTLQSWTITHDVFLYYAERIVDAPAPSPARRAAGRANPRTEVEALRWADAETVSRFADDHPATYANLADAHAARDAWRATLTLTIADYYPARLYRDGHWRSAWSETVTELSLSTLRWQESTERALAADVAARLAAAGPDEVTS